jgi:flagellar biosynthesis chaperone FliJ
MKNIQMLMLATGLLLSSLSFAQDRNLEELYRGDFDMVAFFNNLEEGGSFDLSEAGAEAQIDRLVEVYQNAKENRDSSTSQYIERRTREVLSRSQNQDLFEVMVVDYALRSDGPDYDRIYTRIIRRNDRGMSEFALRVHTPENISDLQEALRQNRETSDEVMSLLENGSYNNRDEAEVLSTMIETNPNEMNTILNSRQRLGLNGQESQIVLNKVIENIHNADAQTIRQVVAEIMNSGASEEEVLRLLTEVYNRLPKSGIPLINRGLSADYEGVGQEITDITEAIRDKQRQIEELLNGIESLDRDIANKEAEKERLEALIAQLQARVDGLNAEIPELQAERDHMGGELDRISNTDIIKEFTQEDNTRIYAGSTEQ